MPEPYYSEGSITLYHGNSLELIPQLELGENVITITDPPYNVGMDYGGVCDDNMSPDQYLEWTDAWWQLVPKPLLVTPGMVNLAMWCQMVAWPDYIIPWVKPNQSSRSKLGGFNAWEAILLYGKLPRKLPHDAFVMSIGQQSEVQGRNGKKHPCPKFLPFYIKLLGNVWKSGWTVFDPFAGSGTTLIACKRLGIPCIGIEKGPEYCDLIVERLQQEVLPLEEVEVDGSVNLRLVQQALALEAVGV